MESIVVWFSCGAASAVAAKKTIEKYGHTHRITIANNPIQEEDEDNRRFLQDVSKWLQHDIVSVTHPDYESQKCAEVWDKVRFMSGPHGAPCTRILKKYRMENRRYGYNVQFSAF